MVQRVISRHEDYFNIRNLKKDTSIIMITGVAAKIIILLCKIKRVVVIAGIIIYLF